MFRQIHGYANLKHRLKINFNSNFYLASVSKTFTGAALMLLQQAGELDLDDNICLFFSDLPPCYEHIKIKNLVNHTAGINDYFVDLFMHGRLINIDNYHVYDFVKRQSNLLFEVGSKHQYSNSGYVLLAMLIELISQQSYDNFMKENIFLPLGMTTSQVFSHDKPIIKDRV